MDLLKELLQLREKTEKPEVGDKVKFPVSWNSTTGKPISFKWGEVTDWEYPNMMVQELESGKTNKVHPSDVVEIRKYEEDEDEE